MTTATKGVNSGTVSEVDDFRFRITCSKFEQFEAGAQVFIKYGCYSNRQLLTHYGFAMKENIYNYARIKIKLGYFLDESQSEALGKGYSPDLFTVFKLKANEFCTELLKTFRVFIWKFDTHKAESFFYPTDLSLELASLEKMKNALLEVLADFPSTIEQDEELIKNSQAKMYFAVNNN